LRGPAFYEGIRWHDISFDIIKFDYCRPWVRRTASRLSDSNICLSTYRKLEPVLERLRADDLEPEPIVDVGHYIPGCRVAWFRDPEGNNIELIEGYRDEV